MLNIEYRINWIKDLFPYIQYSIFNILSLAAVFSLPLVALEGLTTAASAPGHGAGDASFMDLARTIGLGREEYVYSVEWGFLKVGRAQLGSSEIVKYENKDAYHIVSYAKTLPFFDTFYKVRDKNEAWLETRKFFSLGFGKHLREGHFRRNETVVYDHEAGKFKATVIKKNGAVVKEEGLMKPGAYDVLSALYWMRAQDLKPQQELSIDVNTRQDWPLSVRVIKRDKVRVPAGEFHCLVVEPSLRGEGIFIQKGKSMQIWLTDDSRKIPVLVKAEVFIGSVRAELEEIVYSDLSSSSFNWDGSAENADEPVEGALKNEEKK